MDTKMDAKAKEIEVLLEGSKVYKVYINGSDPSDVYYIRLPVGEIISKGGYLRYQAFAHPHSYRFEKNITGQEICDIKAVHFIESAIDFEIQWFNECESHGRYRAMPPNGQYFVDFGEESFRIARAVRGIPIWEDWAEEIIPLLKSEVPVNLVGDGPTLKTIGFLKGKCMRRL